MFKDRSREFKRPWNSFVSAAGMWSASDLQGNITRIRLHETVMESAVEQRELFSCHILALV